MTVRCVTNQSNAPWTSTVEPHHLGAGGGLVDKHQSRRVKRALLSNPASSRAGDVWPSLLRGPQAFFLKVMSCRMKNRDKALRLPTIRRLRIAVTASSNVRSGCSAISANNQPACFSNGETLPPLGFAAELPSSLQRRSQLITELGLTSRSAATSCREAPPSTIAIARTRRSSEYGLAITLSFQRESRAPDSLIRRPLGIPRFEAGEICSRHALLPCREPRRRAGIDLM